MDGSSSEMAGRFLVKAAQIGFSAPPVGLRLKLAEAAGHCSMFLQPLAPTPVGVLVEWLSPWRPLRLEFGSRGVVRADLDAPPSAWSETFRGLDLRAVTLSPDGKAIVSVTGSRSALARFARGIETEGRVEMLRLADPPKDERLLTPPQDHALRTAVAAGYYRIPRPLNLHELAARLGISAASLSERLRRAEGRVISRYVEEGGRTPWDSRAIFEAAPLAENREGSVAADAEPQS